ncbi:MAG TPA: SH3 domain-containing protein [Pedobacter sp.]|nr:SH3 domain-containing protein [Pedobacter sp.]
MKNSFILLFSLIVHSTSYSQNEKLLTDFSIKEGRCTGSPYCRICSNCSRCIYCSSGGSCGVCSRGKVSESFHNNLTNSNKIIIRSHTQGRVQNVFSNGNIYILEDENYSKNYLANAIVIVDKLNLRTGPGVKYPILSYLHKGNKVAYLASIGEWVKIKVLENNLIGFVNRKYIRFTNI